MTSRTLTRAALGLRAETSCADDFWLRCAAKWFQLGTSLCAAFASLADRPTGSQRNRVFGFLFGHEGESTGDFVEASGAVSIAGWFTPVG